jgi:hypothetical protein
LLEVLAEARPNASAPLVNALRHLRFEGHHLPRAQSVTVLSLSLDHQLVRMLISLREEGMRLSFLYVVGGSFVDAEAGAGGSVSSLLPFLPPRDPTGVSPHGASPQGDAPTAPEQSDAPVREGSEARGAISAEGRGLLLSLSTAGIPCLSLGHGEDLVRTLSIWGAGRGQATAR